MYHPNKPFLMPPGPYDYLNSSCGVDETFEVFCTTTDTVIARFRFWDARRDRLIEATILTAALEMLRLNRESEAMYGLTEEEIAQGLHISDGDVP